MGQRLPYSGTGILHINITKEHFNEVLFMILLKLLGEKQDFPPAVLLCQGIFSEDSINLLVLRSENDNCSLLPLGAFLRPEGCTADSVHKP